MFERNLGDLIRGLRNNKKDESTFVAEAVEEIRREVRTKDMELKAAAVLKLTYVRALGCSGRFFGLGLYSLQRCTKSLG